MPPTCSRCHTPLYGKSVCGNCGLENNIPVPAAPAQQFVNPQREKKPVNFLVGCSAVFGALIILFIILVVIATRWAASPEGKASMAADAKRAAIQAKQDAIREKHQAKQQALEAKQQAKQQAQQEAQQKAADAAIEKADDGPNEKQADQSPATDQQPSTDQQMTDNATATHDLGDDGILTSRSDSVDVATTEQANSDMNDAAAAKDQIGYDKVLLDDRAFPVKIGTQAKVIGFGSGLAGISTLHVRIESGSHLGDDGWVEQVYFHKQ